MRTSAIKDRVLKAVIKEECKLNDLAISEYLGFSCYTVYTLLKEMNKEGLIETIETTTVSTGKSATCTVRRIFPQAHHFYNTTSYKKELSGMILSKCQRNIGLVCC